MVGRWSVLILPSIAPKLALVPIGRMSRLLVGMVVPPMGLVGVLGQPWGMSMVIAVHVVPLLAIPTAAIIIPIAASISCRQHKKCACLALIKTTQGSQPVLSGSRS